ncbi:MAG: SGNH/GDSL hydrolase family protein [Candidatus Nanosalina sp.]
MPQIFCLGHSMTYGRWDTEGGWTQRLRRELDERSLENEDEEDFQVWNLGIPGEDSGQLLKRMGEELERRIYEPMQQVILIQVGANDIQYLRERDEVRVSEKEYRENLKKTIRKSREAADQVMLIGEPPITINGPIPWAEEKELSDNRMQRYRQIQKEVSEKHEIPFIDVRNLQTEDKWKKMLEDGCHPDNRGHQKIYKAVEQELKDQSILQN